MTDEVEVSAAADSDDSVENIKVAEMAAKYRQAAERLQKETMLRIEQEKQLKQVRFKCVVVVRRVCLLGLLRVVRRVCVACVAVATSVRLQMMWMGGVQSGVVADGGLWVLCCVVLLLCEQKAA